MTESVQTAESRPSAGASASAGAGRSVWHKVCGFVVAHPFLSVFVAAFLVRFLVALVLSLSGRLQSVAPDSAFFVDFATQLAGGQAGTTATYQFSAQHYGAFLVPVSGLFWIFGPSTFLAQLVAVLFGAVTATAAARLAREFLPMAWAVAAGLVVAFFPSQILWSSAAIRDSMVWAISACMALALAVLLRSEARRQIVVLAIATCVCLLLFGWIREYALTVSALALFFVAVIVRSARFRVAVTLALVLGAMFIPVAFDRDILGTRILRSTKLAQVRVNNAAGADSGFVAPEELTESELDHLPEGLKIALLEPLPWTSLQGKSASWGRLEVPLRWLLLIGSFSALPVLWQRRRALAFVALYAGGIVVVLALGEGNFGTLDRHRGELVWPMTLLAMAGAHHHRTTLQRWWHSVRHRKRPQVAVSD